MIKLSILEFFLISMPESFVFIMGIYFLTKKVISKKNIIIIFFLLSSEAYLIRMLPIHFGVHIFINIIFSITVFVGIANISIKESISYNMIMMIILSISEFISCFILAYIFKINMSLINFTPLTKIMYFIPSFTLFVLSVFIIKKIMDRRK